MDWIDEDRVRISNAVQDWIKNFLVAKEPHRVYREALFSVLEDLWPNQSLAIESSSPGYILLPGLCAQVMELPIKRVLPLHAAWAVLYIAYYLLDKIEDEETNHTVFTHFGNGTVNNLTTGLIHHAQRMLIESADELEVDQATFYSILGRFNKQALAVCAGQHLDLTQSHPSLANVWQIIGAKSGEFFSLGGFLGARLAINDETTLNAFARFGWLLGVIIQIANDIQGLGIDDEVGGDLAQGKWTLPVAYSLHILPPDEQTHLLMLLKQSSGHPTAEIDARTLIIQAGALTYLSLEIERLRYQAKMEIQTVGKPAQPLITLLHRAIDTRDYLSKAQPKITNIRNLEKTSGTKDIRDSEGVSGDGINRKTDAS